MNAVIQNGFNVDSNAVKTRAVAAFDVSSACLALDFSRLPDMLGIPSEGKFFQNRARFPLQPRFSIYPRRDSMVRYASDGSALFMERAR